MTGFDIDPEKIRVLKDGESYVSHIPPEKTRALVRKRSFVPTTGFSELKDADCIIVRAPTPLNKNREPDFSYYGQKVGQAMTVRLYPQTILSMIMHLSQGIVD